MARTFKDLDWDKIDLYLKAGASQKKIAQSLRIHPDTLRDRIKKKYKEDYSIYSTSLQSTGELLLEATQFQKALSGSVQMLIYLGKVRLGQKEPDLSTSKPLNQEAIDTDHENMRLKHENQLLKEEIGRINGNKSETE